jgi:hypothetical protein
VARGVEKRNFVKDLVEKLETKGPLAISRLRWENNIKVNL